MTSFSVGFNLFKVLLIELISIPVVVFSIWLLTGNTPDQALLLYLLPILLLNLVASVALGESLPEYAKLDLKEMGIAHTRLGKIQLFGTEENLHKLLRILKNDPKHSPSNES